MFVKSKKKFIVILSILLLCTLGAYLGYEFLIPSLTSSPRPSEKRKLRKELYNIEQITLMNKDIDIFEFRKLIPYIKIEGLLIVKDPKSIGVARFKNGNSLQAMTSGVGKSVYFTNDGGSSYHTNEARNMLFYYFEGKAEKSWVELVRKSIDGD